MLSAWQLPQAYLIKENKEMNFAFMADETRVLTVTQLNLYVKSLLESSVYLKDISIVGEISNFTNHYKSGHFYLSVKDDTAVIKAVMFKQYASKLEFEPKNGMKVVCRGRVSLYERDGSYQFYITSMQPQGIGDLTVQFERLKAKLKDEGLFDESKKRPIPRLPKSIAVITSETGAAVRDVLNILSRRFPTVKVILCPVQVQGDLAAPSMIEALSEVNRRKCADTIIIGRGGGSIEDLWAFNNEALARMVRASEIPVISGVGHETDFTICDFAADLRAPTPSGAAELAVPDKNDIINALSNRKKRLKKMLFDSYEKKKLRLESVLNRQSLSNPFSIIEQRIIMNDKLSTRLNNAYKSAVSSKKQQFIKLSAKVESLSPMNVLMRGYSAVFSADKTAITTAADLCSGDEISIRFSDGSKDAIVK